MNEAGAGALKFMEANVRWSGGSHHDVVPRRRQELQDAMITHHSDGTITAWEAMDPFRYLEIADDSLGNLITDLIFD
jgi:hypothetical protein